MGYSIVVLLEDNVLGELLLGFYVRSEISL